MFKLKLAKNFKSDFYFRRARNFSIGREKFLSSIPTTREWRHYYEIYPSKVDEDHFPETCAFFKAILKNGLPDFLHSNETLVIPSPTQTNQLSFPCTQTDSIDNAMLLVSLEDKIQQAKKAILTKSLEINAPLREMHRKSVVDAVLNTTMDILSYNFGKANEQFIPLRYVFYPFYESCGADFVTQYSSLFYLNSRIDTGISSPGRFPLLSPDNFSVVSDDEYYTLLQSRENLANLISQHNWPPRCKEMSLCKFNVLPSAFTSFANRLSDPMGYPFLNILVDDKSLDQPLNASQMVLSAFAQLISQARYRKIDSPMACVGIVSNGYRYLFLGIQLNTLNFEHFNDRSEVKNVVWVHEEELYPEKWEAVPPANRCLNRKVVTILGNILRHSYINSLQTRHALQSNQRARKYLNSDDCGGPKS